MIATYIYMPANTPPWAAWAAIVVFFLTVWALFGKDWKSFKDLAIVSGCLAIPFGILQIGWTFGIAPMLLFAALAIITYNLFK